MPTKLPGPTIATSSVENEAKGSEARHFVADGVKSPISTIEPAAKPATGSGWEVHLQDLVTMRPPAGASKGPKRRSRMDIQKPGAVEVREKESVAKDTRLEERVLALYEETVSEPIPDELLKFLDSANRKN